MSDMNQCNFTGRLGDDPTARNLPDGSDVSQFSIGCGWKTKTKEGTEWINIEAFGKLAEICNQYLKKGMKVRVTGRFKTQKWQDNDGNNRYKTVITIHEMEMLSSRSNDDNSPSQQDSEPKQQDNSFEDFDDDIPF